ncbi:MAG: aspartate aminotransferase family protein [Vallitaleaceae bacterium]|jgi:acetylornithine/N-succinyldiaminopimelate aminotransferase|nr:aspartate aminotransferase family protein [Vallitaleaceae bacterium]
MSTLIEQGKNSFMTNYKQFDIVIDHGEGNYVYDIDGKKYLDFVAGIATNSLGYGNQALKDALHAQVDKFLHCSNLYWNEPSIHAATKMVALSGLDKVFFCNSGAESIEASMKLARKAQKANGNDEKTEYISMMDSFHGRTFAAITATGQLKYQKGLNPLFPGVSYGKFNDIESIKALVTDKTCAIMVEPVQGEGGIKPAEQSFMTELRTLCDEKEIILIFDEVQCGIGRTGQFFAYQNYGIKPDIVCLAKGLGSGVPIGAIIANEKTAKGFQPGDHAATFGSNPLVTSAASVVLDVIGDDEFLADVTDKGMYLSEKLHALEIKHDFLTGVRGLGLMQGLVFDLKIDRLGIVMQAMEKGLLLVTAGSDVIRFVPPLTIKKEEIDECMTILEDILSEL